MVSESTHECRRNLVLSRWPHSLMLYQLPPSTSCEVPFNSTCKVHSCTHEGYIMWGAGATCIIYPGQFHLFLDFGDSGAHSVGVGSRAAARRGAPRVTLPATAGVTADAWAPIGKVLPLCNACC